MKNIMIIASLLAGATSAAKAITPEQLLPTGQDKTEINGLVVRKGSIASLIENVRQLNELLAHKGEGEVIQGLIADINGAIPAQKEFHVFDVFSVEDWLSREDRPGNVMAGVLFLQQYPERLTPAIRVRLGQLSHTAHPALVNEIVRVRR